MTSIHISTPPKISKRLISFAGIVSLLLMTFFDSMAQITPTPCNTFVKEALGVGQDQPRIFKNTIQSSRYYLTASHGEDVYISDVNAAGAILTTRILRFPGEHGIVLTDMVVDYADGDLTAVLRGPNNNYMFKYNYTASAFTWQKQYNHTYIFENIHQINASVYIATGEILGGKMTIVEIDRGTGMISSFQNEGDGGEFYSTFDGLNIYGASRYYANASSIFPPSLFQYSPATGSNVWTSTYIKNTATVRIYPVAPIVDNNTIMQLSSGDDIGFNTYLTGNTKVWLMATDMAGAASWLKQITIPNYTRLNAKKIINTPTGYYLLVDAYNGSMTNYFFVIKTDKSGNFQWANRYGISGQNTVINGLYDNNALFLTATSGSYGSASSLLLLKLDQNGMSDVSCGYIQKVNVVITPYNNAPTSRFTPVSPTAYSNSNANSPILFTWPQDRTYCATSCQAVPCSTLSGSLASGVLAFYPFGYGSLLDLSGNGNNLFNTTSAYPTSDRSGNPNCAYHFDKINNDMIHTPLSSFLNGLTTSPFSISLWYQPIGPRGAGDYELLIGRGNPGMGLNCPDTWGQWSVGLFDCRRVVVGFDMESHWEGNAGYPGCGAQMTGVTGNWHHMAFVYDGSNYLIYVDGVLSSNSHGPCGSMSGNIDPLILGSDYTGDLDDVIIYNRALSPVEVTALHNMNNGSCCDGTTSATKPASGSATSVAAVGEAKGIDLYPNPTDGNLSISATSIIRKVWVYSYTGSLVGTYNINSSKGHIDINHLASGVYFVKINTDSGEFIQKLTKN